MPSTTPQCLDQHVDVLEMNEAFEDVDGSYKFTSTLIVYRAGDSVYHAISKTRYSSPSEVRTEHLINNLLIPVSVYNPPFLSQVHNDINPSNIMLDGDMPFIIDFDSCRRVGESLEGVGRTYEWYDEEVQLSLPKNDLDALEEIRIWLGDDANVFQFEE